MYAAVAGIMPACVITSESVGDRVGLAAEVVGGQVVALPQVGGLHHRYERRAA